jgi:hypothetical protein
MTGVPGTRQSQPGSGGFVVRAYFTTHQVPADAATIQRWADETGLSVDALTPRAAIHLINGAMVHMAAKGWLTRPVRGWYEPTPLMAKELTALQTRNGGQG